MFCNKCGKQVKDGADFCPACGAKLNNPSQVQQTFAQPTVQYQNVPQNVAPAQMQASSSNKGLIIGLSIGIGVLVLAVILVVVFLIFGDKIFPKESTKVEVKTEQSESKDNSDKKSDDYLIVDSNTRYLTDAQVQGLSTYDLYIARNEIYARHGRDFKKADLKQYFGSKSWYHVQYTPDYFDAHTNTLLNDYERKNAEKMLAVEKSRNSPYLAP